MILLIGGAKGGTGKTTLATNLAVMRAHEGHDVLLVDTDLQGSASAWAQIRNEDGITPQIPTIKKHGKVVNDLRDLQNRYGDLIVDAGGRDSPELRSAMLAADKLMTPIQASQFDWLTLEEMNDLREMASDFNENLSVRVVITRAPTNPNVREAAEAIEGTTEEFPEMPVAEAQIRERITYRKAASEGRGIIEMASRDAKACAELRTLYREIYE